MNGSIRICPLSSGSSGNCILVSVGGANLLVDCGITGKSAERELAGAGLNPNELDAIIVTHEHADHITGVGIMSRRYKLPVYATLGTWKSMINLIGKTDISLIHYIAADVPFSIKNCMITPFSTSHDAAESIGLVFSDGKKHCGIATDLGTITRHIYDLLAQCSILMIESNHDEVMLKNGPYPATLKQRILSDSGHLSNRVCGALCAKLVTEGCVRQITLAHLSRDNNTPELAYDCVSKSIEKAGMKIGRDVSLYVANRSSLSEIMED